MGLGFQISLDIHIRVLYLILFFFIMCILIKPLVIYLTLKMEGYDSKVSSIVGLNLAQFSEFGIIIVSSGVLGGLISKEIGTIAIISVILSMLFSSYIIKYDKFIYDKVILRYFGSFLKKIEKYLPQKEKPEQSANLTDYQLIFFGYYDLGKELFSKLGGLGKKIIVIENDPSNIEVLKKDGIPYIYNSVANPYFFEHIDFKKAEIVVSSLIDVEDNKMIIKQAKGSNPKSILIVTAKNVKNSLELYSAGADYVIYPYYLNEQRVSVLLEDYTSDINKIISRKISDITKLKEKDSKADSSKTMFEIDDFIKQFPKKERVKSHIKGLIRRLPKKDKIKPPIGRLDEKSSESETVKNDKTEAGGGAN